MIRYLRKGWDNALHQPFLLTVLFVYHFLWGFALYRYVASIVVPLLHRYPKEVSASAVHLFWAEAQFQVTKSNLIQPYLYALLGLFLLRGLITPVLNAGVYFSLHHRQLNAGYRFLKGIKELGAPFLLYYFLQFVLTFAPLYWIVPVAAKILAQTSMFDQMLLRLLPYIIGMVIYGYIVHICFVYVQIFRTTGEKPLASLAFVTRFALQISIISLVILVLSGIIAAIAVSASLLYAGFISLVLYQIYRFISMFCKLLAISSQYEFWMIHR